MSISVFKAIQTAWQAQQQLCDLVPVSRVHVGAVNPGTPTPSVGLTRQQQSTLMNTSSNGYVLVQITAVAEAKDVETLETLADVIRNTLHKWESTRFKSIRLADVAAIISQDEDSPSQLWTGEYVLSYEAYRR